MPMTLRPSRAKRVPYGSLLLLALLALFATAVAAPRASARAENVTPSLAALARSAPAQAVDVIVQFDSAAAARDAGAQIARAGGEPGAALELINGRQARMRAADAVALAGVPGVHAVTVDAPVATADYSGGIVKERLRTAFNQSIGADHVWFAGEGDGDEGDGDGDGDEGEGDGDGDEGEGDGDEGEGDGDEGEGDEDGDSAGMKGEGIGVAVLDSGIAGQLVDFRHPGSSASRVVANVVVHPDATHASDGLGHGTHVAGLIAGDGSQRTGGDLDGRYVGVAPRAHLVNVKVSDDRGATTVADVINGLQFVVEKKNEFNIRVANLSLASTVAQSYTIDPLAAAAEQAWFAGIVVVAASGNSGPDSVKFAPGNDPYVLSVGGVDDRGTATETDDVIAPWTSTGVTQDGFRKPEIMAPGARLVAPSAPRNLYAAQSPSNVVSREYLRLGGTSMAAAVVSGAVALLAQHHPDWTPDQIKAAIISKRRDVPGVGAEIAIDNALTAAGADLVTNTGLTPNGLIDTSTGAIDMARARFGGYEWRAASGMQKAPWGTSYVCSCAQITGLAQSDPLRARFGGADPTRTRFGSVDSTRARFGAVNWSTSFAR